jgi:hypothetical protein
MSAAQINSALTLDLDGQQEIFDQDWKMDAASVEPHIFAKGEKVQNKRCRGKRVTGFVVKQTSIDYVEVFWPDVRCVVNTKAKALKKV